MPVTEEPAAPHAALSAWTQRRFPSQVQEIPITELPSVEHCVMHTWPLWPNTRRKWVTPACGISGWEWNSPGQAVSCCGSAGPRGLTRSLHIVLVTPPAPDRAPGPSPAGMSLGPAELLSTASMALMSDRSCGIPALHLLMLLLSWDSLQPRHCSPPSPGKGRLQSTKEKKTPQSNFKASMPLTGVKKKNKK